jgi:hypothetical protein
MSWTKFHKNSSSEARWYKLNSSTFFGTVPLWKLSRGGGFPAELGGRDGDKDSGDDCQGWWHDQILN